MKTLTKKPKNRCNNTLSRRFGKYSFYNSDNQINPLHNNNNAFSRDFFSFHKFFFVIYFRQLLLCRVTLGKSFLQFNAMKMAHAPPGHHSVVGRPSVGGLSFPEYVVYRGEQVKLIHLSKFHEVEPVESMGKFTKIQKALSQVKVYQVWQIGAI